ncbi:MAG TPA: hypothetical protein VF398_05010, partial [bacterium]|jgi:transcriptional regulator of met regulon
MKRIAPGVIATVVVCSLCSVCCAQQSGSPSSPPSSDTLLTAPAPVSPAVQQQVNQLSTRLDNLGWSLGKVTQLLRDDLTEYTERAALEANQNQNRLSELEEKQLQVQRRLDRISREQRGWADSLRRDMDTLRGQDAELQFHQEALADTFQQFAQSANEEIENIRQNLFTYRFLIGLIVLIAAAAAIAIILGIPKDRKNKTLIEESLKLNARILALLDQQLQLMSLMGVEHGEEEKVVNHALAVRVGIEIFRMQKGFEKIDPEVKGINALKHALALLEEEFIRQGYAIHDLTGQPYQKDSDIKIKKSVEDDTIPPGSPIIEKVITPQILYKGEVVHAGEVEIAVSPKDT